jgi:DNA-binding transcriptional MerR regulator
MSRFVKGESADPSPGLSIGALAARAEVPVETVRIWERRYGVPSPTRSAGRHRRYSEADVARVRWLAGRVATGQRIGEAVAALRLLDPGAGGDAPAHTALVAAALGGDQGAVEREVDRALAALDMVQALEAVVFPALVELGDRWERDQPVIASEHLLSQVVASRLSSLMTAARRDDGPVAVVHCPSGERHVLGAMALCTVLSHAGWQVTFLGADLPAAEAVRMAVLREARLMVAVHTLPRAPDPADAAGVPPGMLLAVAGPGAAGWRGAPDGPVLLGPRLDDARRVAAGLLAEIAPASTADARGVPAEGR